jgi:hypothetical protein
LRVVSCGATGTSIVGSSTLASVTPGGLGASLCNKSEVKKTTHRENHQLTAAIRSVTSDSVVQVIEVPGELMRGNAEQLLKSLSFQNNKKRRPLTLCQGHTLE